MATFPKINKHGVNAGRVRTKMKQMSDNSNDYRPKELARDLAKLAFEVDREAAINAINTLEVDNTTSFSDT